MLVWAGVSTQRRNFRFAVRLPFRLGLVGKIIREFQQFGAGEKRVVPQPGDVRDEFVVDSDVGVLLGIQVLAEVHKIVVGNLINVGAGAELSEFTQLITFAATAAFIAFVALQLFAVGDNGTNYCDALGSHLRGRYGTRPIHIDTCLVDVRFHGLYGVRTHPQIALLLTVQPLHPKYAALGNGLQNYIVNFPFRRPDHLLTVFPPAYKQPHRLVSHSSLQFLFFCRESKKVRRRARNVEIYALRLLDVKWSVFKNGGEGGIKLSADQVVTSR
jgi:hypothetical protein